MGPLEAWVVEVVSMWMTVGCSASSPPLGKIRPRIEFFITVAGREIFDIEDVAHIVLVAREVDLVSVVVVACKHLEGSIRSWSKLGLPFLWKAVLAKV